MFNTMTDYCHTSPLYRALYPSSGGYGGIMNALQPKLYPSAGLLIGALQQQRQQHISQMLSVILDRQTRWFEPLGSAHWRLDEENQDEMEESQIGEGQTRSLTPTNLEAYRASVKAELDELEKQRKALNGQQNALNRRFVEVEGKFQLLKMMESDAANSDGASAETD